MTVIVRFAPSPTGFLHIGGARTALFNWLFARHHGGSFLLRIEDTDRVRSTPEAVAAIIDGLDWLGLDWDGEIVHQFAARRAPCRGRAPAAGRRPRLSLLLHARPNSRRCASGRAPKSARCAMTAPGATAIPPRRRPASPPVIRLKAPQQGATTIHDRVQGEVTVANAELDDLIILRADGTPTYNLSVVVDDHDMGITHVIRGDDHLNNAFRQTQIYRALDWPVPEFAHVPLIHGPDGAKLSKRHGALGVEAYRDMGYLPEALRNYLLRLGWSHGDDEIISTEQAIEWFDLDAVGRAPARFDFAKLDNLNGHYIRSADDARLVALVGRAARSSARPAAHRRPSATGCVRAMPELKLRPKTLVELAAQCPVSGRRAADPRPTTKAAKLLTSEARRLLGGARVRPSTTPRGGRQRSKNGVRAFADARASEARRGRAAVARRTDRVDRLARHLRGHGSSRPRRDASAASPMPPERLDGHVHLALANGLPTGAEAGYFPRRIRQSPAGAERRVHRWTATI